MDRHVPTIKVCDPPPVWTVGGVWGKPVGGLGGGCSWMAGRLVL